MAASIISFGTMAYSTNLKTYAVSQRTIIDATTLGTAQSYFQVGGHSTITASASDSGYTFSFQVVPQGPVPGSSSAITDRYLVPQSGVNVSSVDSTESNTVTVTTSDSGRVYVFQLSPYSTVSSTVTLTAGAAFAGGDTLTVMTKVIWPYNGI